MKKLLFTPALVLLFVTLSIAQNTPKHARPIAEAKVQSAAGQSVVTIGTIESAVTSREKVLAYPRLLAQELNCEVTGFTFTINAGGKTWGPFEVKGAAFPEEVKDKIKETEAPPKVRITIDNIRVRCAGGTESDARPITVEYDH